MVLGALEAQELQLLRIHINGNCATVQVDDVPTSEAPPPLDTR
jgi:hypothetical protein